MFDLSNPESAFPVEVTAMAVFLMNNTNHVTCPLLFYFSHQEAQNPNFCFNSVAQLLFYVLGPQERFH